jgi:DNA-binding CsgD family transcriptional regulator
VELAGLFANPSPEPFIQVAGGLAKELGEAKPAKRVVSSPPRAHKPHLGAGELAALVNGYQMGATTKELGVQFNIHHTTVSGYLRKSGVILRLRSMREEEVAQAVRLYGEGLSLAQIARRLGHAPNTIRSELKREGVAMRDSHGRKRK